MECFICKDLVGGLEDSDYFSIHLGQWGIIIPTDELIFFRGGRYTTNNSHNIFWNNDPN